MSWSDELKGAVGNIVGQAEQQGFAELIDGALGAEGLQTILAKLKAARFADQVGSWLDKNRSNLPISVDQLRAALGDEHLQQLARSLGIPIDAVLAALAKSLPAAAGANQSPAAPAGNAPVET